MTSASFYRTQIAFYTWFVLSFENDVTYPLSLSLVIIYLLLREKSVITGVFLSATGHKARMAAPASSSSSSSAAVQKMRERKGRGGGGGWRARACAEIGLSRSVRLPYIVVHGGRRTWYSFCSYAASLFKRLIYEQIFVIFCTRALLFSFAGMIMISIFCVCMLLI